MSAFTTSAQAAGGDHPSSPLAPLQQQQQQPRSRPTQGELVEQVMASPDFPHYPLIDIAINLTDRSFEKVRMKTLLDKLTESKIKTPQCLSKFFINFQFRTYPMYSRDHTVLEYTH
jgi:hypothetical protein